MKDFGEVITSMITPFDRDLQIDERKVNFLVQYLIDNGTSSVIVGGIAGESESLTRDERILLLKLVKKYANKRIKVIASVGMPSRKENIEFIGLIDDLDYADGYMLPIPYHVGLNQEDIYGYIKEVALSTEKGIMLYNGPIKAGVYIEPQTVISLSYISNIIGIQEASEDIPSITAIISDSSPNFSVYSGDERFTLPVISIGGKGVVSIVSHIKGNEIKEMIRFYNRGYPDRALEYHKKLSPYFDYIHQHRPTFMKVILKQIGIDMGSSRDLHYGAREEEELFAKIVFGGIH